jgi:hypothetical protein
MACLKVEVDPETFAALLDSALDEMRPVDLQAAVMLRRALGLPFPIPSSRSARGRTAYSPDARHAVAALPSGGG